MRRRYLFWNINLFNSLIIAQMYEARVLSKLWPLSYSDVMQNDEGYEI